MSPRKAPRAQFEPWAAICQTGTHTRLCGRGIHYAAGHKGDVSEETTQNWLRVKVKAEPPEIFDPSRRVL